MDSFNIFFEHSAFWIIPALLIAGLFTFLLYNKTTSFSSGTKKLLGGLRFVLLALLLILLITPIIKQIINQYEKPVLIIAVDNSTSILSAVDSVEIIQQLSALSETVNDDYLIEFRALDATIDNLENITFNNLSTNLSTLLNGIRNDYENRNLAAVVLLSDGLFNEGMNPVYSNYFFPIYTIGSGDTTVYKDLSIRQLRYNKLSYQGNKMPLQTEIAHEGFTGKTARVAVTLNGNILTEKTINISQNKGIHYEQFLIDATREGMQRYEVIVTSDEEEKNIVNNRKAAFIDIVKGRKRILLIAPRPHPDIKALEAAISTNENYEFVQYIPVIDNSNVQILNEPVDLVIIHQLPASNMMNDPVWKKFSQSDNSKLWITGTSVNFRLFNELNNTLKVTPAGGQTDNVTAWFSPGFNAFNLSEELKNIFNSLPPVSVPFGGIDVSSASGVLLNQQVGRVQTSKPLLVISNNNDIREGVFIGSGLWQWRLYEYAQHQSHDRINELIIKTVQYLSTKEDKRKFRFYPVKNEFSEGEPVIFESEVYNDLYEPIFEQEINITLTNAEGQKKTFQYMTSPSNTRYAISGVEPGLYQYSATTTSNNVRMEVNGEFAVNLMDIENAYLKANFALLKELSDKTGGSFFTLEEAANIVDELNSDDHKDRIQTSEDFLPFINIVWFGILLLLLASTEWITRKYHGSY